MNAVLDYSRGPVITESLERDGYIHHRVWLVAMYPSGTCYHVDVYRDELLEKVVEILEEIGVGEMTGFLVHVNDIYSIPVRLLERVVRSSPMTPPYR